MRRSWLRLPAGDFSYLEVGEGDPVVFLHALGRSAVDWTTIMEGMSDRWRCLALDQRGHGRSVRCGDYTFESMEADLLAFADTLDLDQFSLVAHSMGGTVGWLFAQGAPDRLIKMVQEDTAPPFGRGGYPEVPGTPPEPVDYDWEARRQLFRQLNSPDPSWWAGIEKVTTPTLIIAGSTNQEELTQAAARLPYGSLTTIEAGHWIHGTQPIDFMQTVRAFLTT